MTDLTASRLHDLASAALVGQGIPSDIAPEIAEEFVIAELVGVRTHGVGKIASLNLGDLNASPDIRSHGAVITVNGNGMSGLVLLRSVAGQLVEMAGVSGVSVASVRNFSRYSSLYPYTEIVARRGLVAILMNSAGPAAVTPFG